MQIIESTYQGLITPNNLTELTISVVNFDTNWTKFVKSISTLNRWATLKTYLPPPTRLYLHLLSTSPSSKTTGTRPFLILMHLIIVIRLTHNSIIWVTRTSCDIMTWHLPPMVCPRLRYTQLRYNFGPTVLAQQLNHLTYPIMHHKNTP